MIEVNLKFKSEADREDWKDLLKGESMKISEVIKVLTGGEDKMCYIEGFHTPVSISDPVLTSYPKAEMEIKLKE